MDINEKEISEFKNSKKQLENDMNNGITPVDFLIITIKHLAKVFLNVEEMPTITADVYMHRDLERAKYDCKKNMIKFDYKIYINAFNEIAEKLLNGFKNDREMKLYETPSCICLATYLFHEIRHYYQKISKFPDFEKETLIENKNGGIDANNFEQVNKYLNLNIEVDATAFSLLAVCSLYSNPKYLSFIDDLDEIKNKEVYKNKIKELSKTFIGMNRILSSGESIEKYL